MNIKVTRTIEITGEPAWVMHTLDASLVSEVRPIFTCGNGSIRLTSEQAEMHGQANKECLNVEEDLSDAI